MKYKEACNKNNKGRYNHEFVEKIDCDGRKWITCNNCGIVITRDDVFKTCGISQVTTGKCYNELNEYFGAKLIEQMS